MRKACSSPADGCCRSLFHLGSGIFCLGCRFVGLGCGFRGGLGLFLQPGYGSFRFLGGSLGSGGGIARRLPYQIQGYVHHLAVLLTGQ